MTAEVAEMVKGGKFAASFGSVEWKLQHEARKAHDDEEALIYLRAKFPGVDESAFFTDYLGRVSQHITESGAVIRAAMIERTCSQCDGKCTLPDRSRKPIVNIEESPAGFKYLAISWTCGMTCKYASLSGEFGRMFCASGLIHSQLRQTFVNYEATTSA